MATIDKGQFFLDHKAVKDGKSKAKYFIALTEADEDEDELVCFVINTEHRMDIYNVGCNKDKGKYVLYADIDKFKFLKNPSSIMLNEPCFYFVNDFYEDQYELLDDVAEEKLCRQIKNCIDEKAIPKKFMALIKECYKTKK